MKNLKDLDVQEMNRVEMKAIDGGCWWCNFRDKVLVPAVNVAAVILIAKKTPLPIPPLP